MENELSIKEAQIKQINQKGKQKTNQYENSLAELEIKFNSKDKDLLTMR